MSISRRNYLISTACTLLPGAALHAQTDAFPSKQPVRILVPFVSGGPIDQTARILSQKLSEIWKQSVIIDNRPGASGIIATEATLRAPADGYTLLFSVIGHSVLPSIKSNLTFDIEKDFIPLSLVAAYPLILVVNTASPIKSVADLVTRAKAAPDTLTYCHSGRGGSSHLCGELFEMQANVSMTDVPYNGNAAALLDVLGGRVDMMFCDIPTALPHVTAGRLRALGISTKERSALLPQLSPIGETVSGYEALGWGGLSVRAGTPPDIAAKLNTDIVAALKDPETRAKLLKIGAEPVPQTQAQYGDFIHTEIAKWNQVVRKANIKME